MVAAIATATAAATTARQRRDGNAMVTVVDSDGRCDSNVMATTAMEAVTATQRQCNGDATAMDGVTATAINGVMTMLRR